MDDARDLPNWLHRLAGVFGRVIANHPDRPGLELLRLSDIHPCEGCGKPYHSSWDDPDFPGLGPCCTGAD